MKLNKFKELYRVLIDNIFNFYLNNRLSKKIRLEKMDKHLIIIDIEKVKEITVNHYINKNEVFINVDNNKIKQIIENFLNVMNKNFDEADLKNLYDNIVWVLFKKHNFFKYVGDYDAVENIIRNLSADDTDTINHELLHLSSNPYDEKNSSGGFYQIIENFTIGYGLDEGYTELLNKRYFNSKTNKLYKTQIICCMYLEKIVGQRNMEKMYLNGNLFGLIKSLKKFASLQEIERFIAAVDFTHDYDDINRLADCEIETLYTQMETILSFLFKGNCKLLATKKYNDDILEYKINKYVDSLIDQFEFPLDEFFIEELNLIIDESLNKNIKLDINRFKDKENVL